MRLLPFETTRLLRRWLIPTALLVLGPKCALCVLAYAGLGTVLGLGGPELCGAATRGPASWALLLPTLGVAGLIAILRSKGFARYRYKAFQVFGGTSLEKGNSAGLSVKSN